MECNVHSCTDIGSAHNPMEFKKKVDKMCSFGLFLDYALTNLILHEELGCWAPIKCSGLCQVYTPVHSIMTNDYNIMSLKYTGVGRGSRSSRSNIPITMVTKRCISMRANHLPGHWYLPPPNPTNPSRN